MDGATLTIAFRDDSPQTQGSPGVTPQAGGTSPTSSNVEDQQRAITQAGGVRQRAEQGYSVTTSASAAQPTVATPSTVQTATASPTPIATASQGSSEGGLAQAIQRIVATDPKATAEEIAKLLGGGVGVRQVEQMMRPAGAPAEPIPASPAQPSSTQPATAQPSPGDTDMLIRRERRRQAEAADEDRRQQADQSQAQSRANKQFDDELQTLIRRERRGQTETNAQFQAAEEAAAATRVTGQQVQTTVNAISHFAHMGGPLGSAVAGGVNAAVAIPAVAEAIGAAAPALVAAAPFAGIALATAAIPAALVSAANNEANRAIAVASQFSPQAIGAEASASVRQLQADIRSSQRLGDEVASIIEGRSRTNTALQGVRDKLSEGPLKDIGNITSAFASAAETLNKFLEGADKVAPGATAAISRLAFLQALNTLYPGLGYGVGILSGVGGLMPKKDQEWNSSMGLVGAIPPLPELPYPFKENMKPEVSITTSGLPPALRNIVPGSF